MSYFTLNNLWILIRQLADIACVWALVYYCLKIVKNNSRTIQIFKGILLVIIIKTLATYFELNTIAAMTSSIMNWGVPAIIIIFQPEIRSILEKIGKTSVFSRISTLTVNERENLVDELVKACAEMSKTKTGALISIEQGHSLSDFIKTGTSMNSMVSSELLCSIFQYGTPLHDGAVIIQGVKIACAAAYFPPTSRELPTSYGARHRAAVGISEITDSITIVVSEETGNISIAQDGKLSVYSPTSLKEFLMKILGTNTPNEEKKEEEAKEAKEAPTSEKKKEGKKPGVFAHYFKNKNKPKVEKTKASKKKKEEQESNVDKDVVVVENTTDKIEIADLAEKQDAPLDQLFETIVDSNEGKKVEVEDLLEPKEEKKETDKPKEKKSASKSKKNKSEKKAEKKSEPNVEEVKNEEKKATSPIANMDMAKDLFDDIIEPEAIVLHYEPTSSSKDKTKGSDI